MSGCSLHFPESTVSYPTTGTMLYPLSSLPIAASGNTMLGELSLLSALCDIMEGIQGSWSKIAKCGTFKIKRMINVVRYNPRIHFSSWLQRDQTTSASVH